MTYAMVLGSADCLFHDAMACARWAHQVPVTIIAVNDAGWLWPDKIDHWVSLHGENFPDYQRKRFESGANMDYETWSREKDDGAKLTHRLPHWGVGTSGLYAVTVAFHLGIDRVVLCGVPMEPRPHVVEHMKWGEADWPQSGVEIHRPGWEYWLPQMAGRVKSWSTVM